MLISTDDCVLDIASAVPISVTWAQVKTTFEALLALCVLDPLTSSAGGRAYTQSRSSSKRDAVTQSIAGEFFVLPESTTPVG